MVIDGNGFIYDLNFTCQSSYIQGLKSRIWTVSALLLFANCHRTYMEKHVHSILAKDFQRKKRKTHKPITNKNTHKHRQVTLHTNEKGRQDPGCPALRTGAVG